MKRKLLTVLLTLITALCLCFGLAACNGEGKDGIGIKSVEVDENGDLKVTLDDGTVLNAGKVTADEPAEEGTEGLQYQKIEGENGEGSVALVGLGTAWDTDIVIPSSYRGLKVTAIGNNAFNTSMDARNANLTSITIPESVTSIGSSAFEDCSSLESIVIPNNVTEIEKRTFYGCTGLTSIVIPDSVTSIGQSAFEDCSSLESIVIPDSVTSIGQGAFYGCSSLESVTIGSGVTSIGNWVFEYCSSLESVTIGSGVTSIGNWVFGYCSSLTSVYYMGTADEWNRISIDYYNEDLGGATRYYYSAEENYDGEHWHYDPVTNQPVVWTKEEA